MDTLWYESSPRAAAAGAHVLDREAVGDPCLLIGEPDWVRVPDGVPGEEPGPRRVEAVGLAPCPCGGGHDSKTYALAGGLLVAACTAAAPGQFLWYRPRQPVNPEAPCHPPSASPPAPASRSARTPPAG